MAQAPIEDALSVVAESSTTITIVRDNDLLSQALRGSNSLEIDDIIHLHNTPSPTRAGPSTIATSSTTVFSSDEESLDTKPTSACSTNPTFSHNIKGKVALKTGYASSLSGTHGSASEAEAGRRAIRREQFLGLGHWAGSEREPLYPLKGEGRAQGLQSRKKKLKKPRVAFDLHSRRRHGEHDHLLATASIRYGGTARRASRHSSRHTVNPLRSAEEGQSRNIDPTSVDPEPLAPARIYCIAGIVMFKLAVLLIAAYGAHVTGRSRMSCTRGIVFFATALLTLLTVLAMLTARRALSEALLAGLVEFALGFALLEVLNDFM